jgi:hypothetical protein
MGVPGSPSVALKVSITSEAHFVPFLLKIYKTLILRYNSR